MVYIVEEISLKFNILEGSITIACDGLNAIKKSIESETRYSCLSNHFYLVSGPYDLIMIIWTPPPPPPPWHPDFGTLCKIPLSVKLLTNSS